MHDSYQDGADGCEDTVTDMSPLVLGLSRRRGFRNKNVVLYTGCLGAAGHFLRGHILGDVDCRSLLAGIQRSQGQT